MMGKSGNADMCIFTMSNAKTIKTTREKKPQQKRWEMFLYLLFLLSEVRSIQF